MTQSYRGSYLMPALEKARVADVIVSDMDIVRAAGAGIEGHTAADAARTEVVTVEPDTSLADAAVLMDKHDTAHLIVTSSGRPAAVISSLDIAGALAWGRA